MDTGLGKSRAEQTLFFEVIYGIDLIAWFVSYSMLTQVVPALPKYIAVFNILALFIYVARGFNIDEKIFWIGVVLLVSVLISYYTSRDVVIVEIGVLLFISQSVNKEKILKEYIIIASSMIIIVFMLSQLGIIQDLLFVRNGITRHAFGTIQPTVLSAQLFSLSAAIACLRYKHITYPKIGILILLAVVCFRFLNARNDTMFILLIVLVLVVHKLRWKTNGNLKFFRYLSILSMPLLSLVVFLLGRNYTTSSRFLSSINNILSDRLRISNVAISRYPINWFGQQTIENGNGAGTQVATANYFYIDSSYLRLLIRYGFLLFLIIMILYVLAMVILMTKKKYVVMAILVIMSAQVMWEQSFLCAPNVLVFYLIMNGTDYSSLMREVNSASKRFVRFMEE
ncbi:hypothetical protein LJA01_15960 [Lactobacillus japonicus]|nr:hypothetical protein LJA01_15960 [Lactobacillus japonicus]